jgi:quercetin dioxygenase-like cupin family protein
MFVRLLAATILAYCLSFTASLAQQPAITQGASNVKRTPLQKFEVPGTNYETVIAIAEAAPNVTVGRHMHPGPESGYVIEGELVLMIAGQPDKVLKVGDSYMVPRDVAHDAKSGPQGVKVVGTYVVDKGKPLATPAP